MTGSKTSFVQAVTAFAKSRQDTSSKSLNFLEKDFSLKERLVNAQIDDIKEKSNQSAAIKQLESKVEALTAAVADSNAMTASTIAALSRFLSQQGIRSAPEVPDDLDKEL